jgi:hypothetical protein
MGKFAWPPSFINHVYGADNPSSSRGSGSNAFQNLVLSVGEKYSEGFIRLHFPKDIYELIEGADMELLHDIANVDQTREILDFTN